MKKGLIQLLYAYQLCIPPIDARFQSRELGKHNTSAVFAASLPLPAVVMDRKYGWEAPCPSSSMVYRVGTVSMIAKFGDHPEKVQLHA
nr:hypothetical protein CFP56_57034 [Quercus suber]